VFDRHVDALRRKGRLDPRGPLDGEYGLARCAQLVPPDRLELIGAGKSIGIKVGKAKRRAAVVFVTDEETRAGDGGSFLLEKPSYRLEQTNQRRPKSPSAIMEG